MINVLFFIPIMLYFAFGGIAVAIIEKFVFEAREQDIDQMFAIATFVIWPIVFPAIMTYQMLYVFLQKTEKDKEK